MFYEELGIIFTCSKFGTTTALSHEAGILLFLPLTHKSCVEKPYVIPGFSLFYFC